MSLRRATYGAATVMERGWLVFFRNLLNGKVNSFGIGTMMHETMHKSMVGGGFTHNDPPDARDMRTVLEAAGATPNGDPNERNIVSYEFGHICFNTY